MKKIFALLLTCAFVFSLVGCAAPTEEIDVCGQQISVLKDTENEVIVEITNCVSQVDGYEYPTDLQTLKGNPDVIATKAKNTFDQYRKQFPDCQFRVVSINDKQVENQAAKLKVFDTGYIWLFCGILILFYIALIALLFIWFFHRRKKVKETIFRLTSEAQKIPAEEFIAMREIREGKRRVSNQSDFTGIYIIHNVSKDMYYVGQSKTVLKRISSHFGGSGNGDVYADFKYGDEFTIQAVPLSESGYSSLDALERDAIQTYNAFEYGYNRNRGVGNKAIYW